MSERMETDEELNIVHADVILKSEIDDWDDDLGPREIAFMGRTNDFVDHPGDHYVETLACGKTFTDNPTRVNCVDFSPDGMVMIASNVDDSLSVYNLHTGVKDKNVCVNSKKYGVGLIRYGGNPNTAIHSSTKIDHNLRYLNLHDNKYLRYFTGHTEKVTCLHVSPYDDKVISGSNDKTLRLWDLRTQHCQGVIEIPEGRPIGIFDNAAEVFVVSSAADSMRFYDMRFLENGPFVVYNYEKPDPKSEVVNLDFSRDGNYVLQNMNSGHIRIVDFMTGSEKYLLEGHKNDYYDDMEASFSPDGNFVFSGSSDGMVYGWDLKTGWIAAELSTMHDSLIKVCRWNPRHCMLATACSKICMWAPDTFNFSDYPRRRALRAIKREIKEEPLSEH